MKIKKIQLTNGYKRFFDLTIDLGENPKRIVALVGPNGCGKSSVFDGMLYHNNAHSRIGNKSQQNFGFHSMNKMPNFDYRNVLIDFEKERFYSVWLDKSMTGKQNTMFSFRSPYRYNTSLKVSESKATSEIRLNEYGATTTIDIDDKMEENYRRLNIKYNKYLNDTDSRPSEAKTKIIGDLNESLKNCLDLHVTSIGDIEANQGTLYFTKKDQTTQFEFDVLSSGEKEVVDILLDLYLRQDEYNDTVFLFDEPELHINTSIQRNLLIEINKLIGANCQIWIATHSIGFLRALQDDFKEECQIIQFKKDTNWASSAHILLPMKKTRANWITIFETALDDLTGLVSPKEIIYCEGRDHPGDKGKEKGFDAKVFNNIFTEKHHETLFISSGGNTELDQRSEIAIAILTKVFSDVKILVLKDRDMASGKDTNENDRLLYLKTNPENHRVLKRWEIENYLYDKEVLKKFCVENNKIFDESEYDKYVKDVENQNLKDDTGRIKNFCGISASVNAANFKLSLSEIITEDMTIYQELEKCIF